MAWQKCVVLRKMCWSVIGGSLPACAREISFFFFIFLPIICCTSSAQESSRGSNPCQDKKKKAVKAIFPMIVGESPVKEMMIQLKACFSNLKKKKI